MRLLILVCMFLALAATAWKVASVRSQLANDDVPPDVVARVTSRLETIPHTLGQGLYGAEDLVIDADIIDGSGADVYVSRRYASADGRVFDLYVGGAIRNQENFHSPGYCMPAAGWEVLEDSMVPFRVYGDSKEGPRMRRLVLQRATEKMLVYFWFQAGPRVAVDGWTIRWYRFRDLLAGAELRPAMIVTIYAPVLGGLEATESATTRFFEAIGPHLQSVTVNAGALR